MGNRAINILIITASLFLFTRCTCVSSPKKSVDISDSLNLNYPKYEITDSLSRVATSRAHPLRLGVLDAGKATKGETISGKFILINTQQTPLIVEDIKSNCGCLKIDYSKKPLKSGERSIMTYHYNTRGKLGQQFSEIKIESNRGDYIILLDLLIK